MPDAREPAARTDEADQVEEEQGRTAADERTEATPEQPTADRGTDRLGGIPRQSYLKILRRTAKEFSDDNITVWAAALTYYAVLSIFPGLLLIVTVLRLFGPNTVKAVTSNLGDAAPGAVSSILTNAANNLANGRQGTAGLIGLVSLVGALWSASGYIGVFMQASNVVYDVPEGRPIWKKLPIRIGVTLLTGIMLVLAAVLVVFTGKLADLVGRALGLGSTVVTIWSIAKWPVLLVLVSLLFAILYWASPNAKHGGFRWVSPGGGLAVLIWLIASGGFAVYVANFASYNKTYGALATPIIFFVWLWISNIAILLGAEFDAEIQRSRAIQAGHPETEEPYLDLRDDRKVKTD